LSDSVISPELAEFISSPVMMIASTRDDRFRATIGRGTGAQYSDGCIDFFVSAPQWPDLVNHAAPSGKIATTYVRPTDYTCYQIKGEIVSVTPATDIETARGQLYIDRVLRVFELLEVRRMQLSHSLCARGLVRIRFRPRDVFKQSPGPGAGARLAGAAA
jgi:hypothetical protein